jgi:hypothetical protein
MKNRRERMALWKAAAGRSGLVSAGNVEWLLDVSDTRVKKLMASVLKVVPVAGQKMISFASVEKYATRKKRLQLRK